MSDLTPPPPHGVEVTVGEVYRAILALTVDVKDMKKDLIARPEYEADQESHVTQHKDLAKQIADVRVEASTRTDSLVRTWKWIGGGFVGLLTTALLVILPHLRWG